MKHRIVDALCLFTNKEANSQVQDVDKEEVFNVIDPNAQGDQNLRPVSIQFSKQKATDELGDYTQYVLGVIWEDIWEFILNVVTDDDKLESDYIDLVDQLKAIDEKVKADSIDEAKNLFLEFIKQTKLIEAKYAQKIAGEPDESHMINGNEDK